MVNTYSLNGHETGRPLIDVCLTPSLFHLYDASESIVVVIDVLRATSSICIAFEHGVRSIIPVSTVEEAMELKKRGCLAGAERDGAMLEGFDFGNSPFSYMDPKIKGRDVALTTTNGTFAINTARLTAKQVAIGSFLNYSVLCDWLVRQKRSVIALCAGWKGSFNLEDTLFAGALVYRLKKEFGFSYGRDACIAAEYLYMLGKNDLYGFLEDSSHRLRLEKLNIEKDIAVCLTPDQTQVVPVLREGALMNEFVLQASGV
jgi:2-phosphosulfolactate phosphatase